MRILSIGLLCLMTACSTPVAEPAPQPEAQPPEIESRVDETPPVAPKLDIVITTGVHGNEPSGVHVMELLKERGFIVFGPCNPWGFKNNSRYLENGDDLNRSFADSDYPEVLAVKEFLKENPPKLLLDLHEDPDGTGCYLIQHGPEDEIGRRIIDEMKDEFDFHPNPRFLMVKGEDGLLKPTREQLRALKFINIYGLAFHAWDTYGCTTIVTECPGTWDLEKKKAYQLRVCELAKRFHLELVNGRESGDGK